MARQTFVMGRLGKVLQIAAVVCLMIVWLPGPALSKPSAASPANSLYDNAKKAYYQLLENAQRVPNRDDWVSVIRLFEKVLVTYPQTELAYKAAFTVGRLYQKLGKKLDSESDLREAGRYYSLLLKEYPEGHLNDDSLFHLADLDMYRKDYQGARERLQSLLKMYPEGDRVEASRKELKRLVRLLTKAPTTEKTPNDPVEVSNKDSLTPEKPENLVPALETVETEKNKHVPLVVVDAGHGGKDHGAIGHHGLKEKEVNLNISKEVAAILTKRYKFRVVLTRDDDRFIELADRGKIANQKNADLFVSIHANAAPHKAAQGIETYYLGSGSTEQARETAARENGNLIYSVADDEVQQILASLISTTKINDSSRLASKVQKILHGNMVKRYRDVHDLGVKEGPFFVLHDTNMPSILVEVGFVTNQREEKRLGSKAYQKALAEAIAHGIYEFLKEKAPSI
ncbi:putative N-acetylmuramoyl-L-alanine amidase [Nitrospina gracilis 3/211]|uniref:N-acetylmuramoyl-L-alanine amidase n=1 Tax=Nitrospina gracilis (strain 3/211) TaxID=1266370 RepID=M1ZEI2_NITG3|nr:MULTISPECIES: N-acetylmuramoyl-L-alanine amidase [Nitrospina]MCF8724714.1 N-acetylmuramoyl-L-alanine amidase [Nitrospina sp. Nb-3]CCQ91986.1 putative N-acetylmuramoyl-L-alanine amidase [Nitrospina gracilis 3/211]